MADGKYGRMVEWREWLHTYYLRYTHTDDIEDDDTLIFYSIDRPFFCLVSGLFLIFEKGFSIHDYFPSKNLFFPPFGEKASHFQDWRSPICIFFY
jgi:hypothetical protein